MGSNLNLEYRRDWIRKMAGVCEASSTIDPTLFDKYEVKREIGRASCRERVCQYV